MVKKRMEEVLPTPEPTNEQLVDGSWQQPPALAHTQAVVHVPEGVFARLAQAREYYLELTPAQLKAYKTVTQLSVPAKEFALKGDMSPDTANALAAAVASKVFDDIEVCVPASNDVKRLAAAAIGTIGTVEGVRIFLINAPGRGMWGISDVVSRARLAPLREWWADYWLIVLVVVFIAAMIAWPIVAASVTGNPAWLWWLLAEAVIAIIISVWEDF
jgi:hypothetical protein